MSFSSTQSSGFPLIAGNAVITPWKWARQFLFREGKGLLQKRRDGCGWVGRWEVPQGRTFCPRDKWNLRACSNSVLNTCSPTYPWLSGQDWEWGLKASMKEMGLGIVGTLGWRWGCCFCFPLFTSSPLMLLTARGWRQCSRGEKIEFSQRVQTPNSVPLGAPSPDLCPSNVYGPERILENHVCPLHVSSCHLKFTTSFQIVVSDAIFRIV